jgi:ABC-type multidrug transport system fused ATPase/permease subunit
VDINNQSFSLIWILNRWLGVRIDFVGALLALTATMCVVWVSQSPSGIDAGFAGLSIAYSLSLSESLLWLVRNHAMMEMEMNAVERVDEYLQIEEEAPAIMPSRPASEWPFQGQIRVKNLTLRYDPEGPAILSGVNFDTIPGEKIGIVGRTGAGKTTLSLAFFRFMEAEKGQIIIDGVDIATIGLYDLRSKLTVIPQGRDA